MPHAYHQTEAFLTLLDCITTFFAEKNIPVCSETLETILGICGPNQKKTKKVLMHTLVQSYPALTHCYQKELRNKNKYYIKVFEAVAAASLHA
jgi:hypothetical protein